MSSTFYTIQQSRSGYYEVYGGNSRTGIATAECSFSTYEAAQRYIDQKVANDRGSGWLTFVNGDRNAPRFPR